MAGRADEVRDVAGCISKRYGRAAPKSFQVSESPQVDVKSKSCGPDGCTVYILSEENELLSDVRRITNSLPYPVQHLRPPLAAQNRAALQNGGPAWYHIMIHLIWRAPAGPSAGSLGLPLMRCPVCVPSDIVSEYLTWL